MAIKSKPKTPAVSKKPSVKKPSPGAAVSVSQIIPVNKPADVALPKPPPLPIPIEKAVLSPELLATVKTEPPTAKAVPLVDEREKAREERRFKKQAEMDALRQRREVANAGVPADSLPPIHAPVTALPRPVPRLVPAPSPTAISEKGEVRATIPEALKYKLLYCESAHRTVAAPLVAALTAAAKAKLSADIALAIKTDPSCKAAADKMQVCVNEILDALQPSLPPGYAVKFLKTEEGFAICNFDPESAGKRVQVA